MDDHFLDELYPELTLETDDIIMALSIKKDYSQIEDLDKKLTIALLPKDPNDDKDIYLEIRPAA